jgi:hypothetical protein
MMATSRESALLLKWKKHIRGHREISLFSYEVAPLQKRSERQSVEASQSNEGSSDQDHYARLEDVVAFSGGGRAWPDARPCTRSDNPVVRLT